MGELGSPPPPHTNPNNTRIPTTRSTVIEGAIHADGPATISEFTSQVTFAAGAEFKGNDAYTFEGPVLLKGATTVSGAATLSGTTALKGDTSFDRPATLKKGAEITGSVNVAGAVKITAPASKGAWIGAPGWWCVWVVCVVCVVCVVWVGGWRGGGPRCSGCSLASLWCASLNTVSPCFPTPCSLHSVALTLVGDNTAPVKDALFVDGGVKIGSDTNGKRRNLAVTGSTTLGSSTTSTPIALTTKGGADVKGHLRALTANIVGQTTGERELWVAVVAGLGTGCMTRGLGS